MLYIPTGWYHANVNCGQTVAVSAQVDVTADDAADMTGPEGYMKPFAAALNAFKRGQEQESIVSCYFLPLQLDGALSAA